MDELHIDCFGEFCREVLSVTVDGRVFHFVYAAERKVGRRFSLGLFLNDAAQTRACFRYPRSRRVALLLESPLRRIFAQPERLERRFDHVFTYHRQFLECGRPYIPFYYGVSWVGAAAAAQPVRKTRLLSFVGSVLHGDAPGYALRKAAAQRLADAGLADCYGRGIRDVGSKTEALADYCFSVAMENAQQDYYFTEKLIDCFLMETVPVYWGCAGIGTIFDERGIVRFETLDELTSLAGGLSFERYQQMLPFVLKNKQMVLDNGWTDYEGLYRQLAGQLAGCCEIHRPLRSLAHGKTAAAIRWAASAAADRFRVSSTAAMHSDRE